MEVFLPVAHIDVNIAVILLYGALVGFLSGLVGVGGGFLITPLLIFSGVPPIVAVSTGATQIAGTASGASYLHWRRGNIDFHMGLILLVGSLSGGACGVFLGKMLLVAGQFENVLAFLYVILLGAIGVSMMIESLRTIVRATPKRSAAAPSKLARSAWLQSLPWQTKFTASGVHVSLLLPLVLGAAVGILTSLMGVGGGFIMVPAMIYALKMPTRIVIGTSLFQLLFTTAAVSIMQAGINHAVDPFLALTLILGSVFGVDLGARLGARMSAEKLRLVLALVVVAVAAKMLLSLVLTPGDVYHLTER